jgi:hypothetical protein
MILGTRKNEEEIPMASTVLQMPKPPCEQVTQNDLLEYRLFAKELRQVRLSLREKRKEILAKLLGGADVEDGISEAEIVTARRGDKTIVRLMVRW